MCCRFMPFINFLILGFLQALLCDCRTFFPRKVLVLLIIILPRVLFCPATVKMKSQNTGGNMCVDTKHQHKNPPTSVLVSPSMKTDSPNSVEGTDSSGRPESESLSSEEMSRVPPSPASHSPNSISPCQTLIGIWLHPHQKGLEE